MTAGNQAAMTAEEWLLGVDRGHTQARGPSALEETLTGPDCPSGPVLMSLKPGTAKPTPQPPAEEAPLSLRTTQMDPATREDAHLPEKVRRSFLTGHPSVAQLVVSFQAFLQEQLAYQDAKYPREPSEPVDWQPDDTLTPAWTCPSAPQEPAQTLLLEFYRQQDQIRELREELKQKNVSGPPAEAQLTKPPTKSASMI